MVGRDRRVQRCYEDERRGLPRKDETSAKRVQVPMRLPCVQEDSQHVWREARPTWRWSEVSWSLLQYGEVVVEASNPSPGNEGSQQGMTGGEMSGRLHTIDGQQEEARLSSTINGPWRGESRR